jgi:hypothetical protein
MENTPYMDSISAGRALLLSEEEALEGATTISLETCGDLTQEEDVFSYIQDHFAEFLKTLRYLKKEDQELLLSYYLLSKTQNTLALIHKSTQTVCSFRIRMAVKTLCAFIMMGEPTPENMHDILEKAGLESSLEKLPLSTCIDLYAKTRSFQRIAEVHHLHRPDIRRAMSRASKQLMESRDAHEHALGAYIHSLIDKANPSGVGYSKRKAQKLGHIFRRDSDILGMFRIPIEHPDFEEMFVSRANR